MHLLGAKAATKSRFFVRKRVVHYISGPRWPDASRRGALDPATAPIMFFCFLCFNPGYCLKTFFFFLPPINSRNSAPGRQRRLSSLLPPPPHHVRFVPWQAFLSREILQPFLPSSAGVALLSYTSRALRSQYSLRGTIVNRTKYC